MTKVLFICHGNICRSAMAEYIFKDMTERLGIADRFYIDSAATSREEIGNPVYPPAKKLLESKGIRCDGHHAKQVTRKNYDEFDYLLCMEEYNLRNIRRIIPYDSDGKIKLLLDFSENPRDIADPWYTGDFYSTYYDIIEGCEAFLKKID